MTDTIDEDVSGEVAKALAEAPVTQPAQTVSHPDVSAARAAVALALEPLGRLSAAHPEIPALLAGINAAFHAFANSIYGVVEPVAEAPRDELSASVTADGPVVQAQGNSAPAEDPVPEAADPAREEPTPDPQPEGAPTPDPQPEGAPV